MLSDCPELEEAGDGATGATTEDPFSWLILLYFDLVCNMLLEKNYSYMNYFMFVFEQLVFFFAN